METTIFNELVSDLSDGYRQDDPVLKTLIADVITDALSMSNRTNSEENITKLKSNVKKAVKSIYLQRGTEDSTGKSLAGESNTYDETMKTMLQDIIRQNKRLL